MLLEKLKLLINLAKIDGEVDDKEKTFIINIGKANQIPSSEVTSLFDNTHQIIIPTSLTADQRFDYIFSLVQLLKIDERLYKEEIRFCAKVASKLGYDQHVMFDLMLHVREVMEKSELDALKTLTASYLTQK